MPHVADADFDRFWDAYPKRRAKADARKAWAKLRPAPDLVEAILEALAWQSLQPDWLKDDRQFVPYPATWLRGERWEDEPVTELMHLSKQTTRLMNAVANIKRVS